jgi:hypothetical protein
MSLEMGSLSRLVPSLAASEQSWMGWDGMGWGGNAGWWSSSFSPQTLSHRIIMRRIQRCTGEISKSCEIGSDRGYLWLLARSESSRVEFSGRETESALCGVA